MQTDSLLNVLSKNTPSQIKQIEYEVILYLSLTYLHFALYTFDFVPYWSFILFAPMYIARWMINLHDLMHLLKPSDVNWLIRLHPVVLTPFSLGYKEIRDIHMRHHAYTITDNDPDLYHIKGNFFTSFIKVTLSPEISAYHYVREKGIDTELLVGSLFRFSIFISLALILGEQFLYLLVPLRLCYGACMYSISFPLHRSHGDFGTYTPHYPVWLQVFMTFLFGREALNTLSHHDIHHDHPKITSINLPKARKFYTPRPTSLSVR